MVLFESSSYRLHCQEALGSARSSLLRLFPVGRPPARGHTDRRWARRVAPRGERLVRRQRQPAAPHLASGYPPLELRYENAVVLRSKTWRAKRSLSKTNDAGGAPACFVLIKKNAIVGASAS